MNNFQQQNYPQRFPNQPYPNQGYQNPGYQQPMNPAFMNQRMPQNPNMMRMGNPNQVIEVLSPLNFTNVSFSQSK